MSNSSTAPNVAARVIEIPYNEHNENETNKNVAVFIRRVTFA